MNRVSGRHLGEGLNNLRKRLRDHGYTIQSKSWQGTEDPPTFLEILHADLVAPMSNDIDKLSDMLGADQPWATLHFLERVGGEPLNPPPSHKIWLKNTDDYLSSPEAFSHSYPERMWGNKGKGIRFDNANLDAAVELLKKEPDTRQCYIPMWFPEDLTAANQGERVPCSFGWHVMKRGDQLHCSYHMRSCDVVRHLHNDLYFANRLVLWLNEEANLGLDMGYLHFSSSSLHCFENDRYTLNKLIKE